MFYYILILFNMPDIQKQMDLVIYEKKHTKENFLKIYFVAIVKVPQLVSLIRNSV